jgi:mandelate racemase
MPKIVAVHTTPVMVPMARPVRTASGHIGQFPVVLIDVETDAGITGCSYGQVYIPELIGSLESAIRGIGQLAVGMELAPRNLHSFLLRRVTLWGTRGTVGTALGGLDMAFWDAWCKVLEQPLYRVLGAEARPLKAYFSVGMYNAEAVVEVVDECLARDFEGLKIKLGLPSIEEDLAVVRVAKKRLGGRALMVDYNQSLSPLEAEKRCRALDSEGLEWIEEPVLATDYVTTGRLASLLQTPVQIGENFHGSEDMRLAIAARASDLVMPDAQFIRGVTGWMEAAALARVEGIPISSHTFLETSTHLMCASATADWLEHMDVVGTLLAEPVRQKGGRFLPGNTPGIGINWDRDKVRAHQMN